MGSNRSVRSSSKSAEPPSGGHTGMACLAAVLTPLTSRPDEELSDPSGEQVCFLRKGCRGAPTCDRQEQPVPDPEPIS